MSTIFDMIDRATGEGEVITLTEDMVEAVRVPEGRNVVIDLGGFTWTAPQGETPITVEYSTVTLRNGTISGDGNAAIRVGAKDAVKATYVTLAQGLTVRAKGHAGVFLSGKGHLDTYADIDVDGEFGCIQGNGSEPYFGNSATIHGGRLTSKGTAIYWPQEGDLRIYGGEVTGVTGVEVRAGTVSVRGGTITGTAVPTSVTPNGNGSTSLGAGLAIAQHTTMRPVAADISGGTIQGYSAVYESNPEGNPAEAVAKVAMDISGGTMKAVNGGTVAVYAENVRGFVRGGTFNTPVATYLVSPGISMTTDADGNTVPARADWVYPDTGAVTLGMGMKRLVMTCARLIYPTGGITMSGMGIRPVCAVANVPGGASAHVDPVTGAVRLYVNGAEAEGTLDDVSLIVFGY